MPFFYVASLYGLKHEVFAMKSSAYAVQTKQWEYAECVDNRLHQAGR